MSLTIEWRRRIDNWRKELPEHFYIPLDTVALEGFITLDQLSAQEALQGDFVPMPAGTKWGAKWEYGWFKTAVSLPKDAAGERIVLKVGMGEPGTFYKSVECTVFINGTIVGARDYGRQYITLAHQAQGDETYDILVEAYAGHGPRVIKGGPNPQWRETVPEPDAAQTIVAETSFGIWQEEIFQLWLDIETLYTLRENIDQNTLRVAEIDKALREFTLIVDFELSRAEVLQTVRECREYLQPLLACVNGSTTPTMYAFGHAHLDVAWLWPLAETERKASRTCANQITLMDEYPEFKFLHSQPHLYRMIKERQPDLYERVKAYVAKGQIIAEGGSWVEPDTNMPSGESLIRQFVHGKRFLKEEFGVDSELLWLPDVFGYSGALPQIMRGCGIKYFSTAKIFWCYNGGEPFPYNTFTWEGVDGSEILVHLCNNYNSPTDPGTVIERWNQRVQKDDISARMLPFGFGDGGGGPTRTHLEYIRRQQNLEGAPKIKMATPNEFFDDQIAAGFPDKRYVGELYFQDHRGTFTSQAKTKLGNRRSEIALHDAELWGVAAKVMTNFALPMEALDEAWKMVLLNQFHDILPGSSIARVYEEAEAGYASVIETAKNVTHTAQNALTDDADALTVFNSVSWQRRALVALPEHWETAVNQQGHPLPIQSVAQTNWVEVQTPSYGMTTIYPHADVHHAAMPTVQASPALLENNLLRVEFNALGEITAIMDKENGRNWADGLCNSIKMYKDVPTMWDAWDLDSMYEQTPVALDSPAEIEVITTGPLFAQLRVKRQLHNSQMTQLITLHRNSRRIEFHTVIDWQERHKLLKVNFPVTVYANEGVQEIQFGHIRRPNHKSRKFDADRFEVAQQRWTALMEENRGCAVLNDCKYGVNVAGNSINLTLLKSAMAPDMHADIGRQAFTYAFYAWDGTFMESDVVRQGYELNYPVQTAAGAAQEQSLFQVDAPNVIIETVKPAEDGSNDVIVRLYEAKRTLSNCILTTTLPVEAVYETDMLENVQEALPFNDGQIGLHLRPFAVKTLRLKLLSK